MFNKFARNHGFDPLVAKNWYYVSRQDVLEMKVCIKLKKKTLINIFILMKGAERTMNYYDRSFVNALIHLYPDVGFDRVQFLEGNTSRLITPLSLPSYISLL